MFQDAYRQNDGPPLGQVRIDTLPDNGTLKLSGANVSAGQKIPIGDIGNLTFEPDANANSTTSTFSFQWTGGSGNFFAGPAASASFSIAAVNDAPDLTVTAGSVTAAAGGSASAVDSAFTVADIDSTNFDGGQFTVQVTTNNTADDRLTVTNQGTGSGQIGFNGTTVTYGGTAIGTINGSNNGTGTAPLRIDLNASATPAALQALARAVTYQNVNAGASASPVVSFTLTDGDGGTSAVVTRAINFSAAPTLTATSGLTGFLPGDGAVTVDPTITVFNSTGSYNGGYLRATISANGETADRLTIENQGTGATQIGFDGTTVTYGGTTIGTASGGTGTTALNVTLNANATNAAVQKLAQAIQFNSGATEPGTGNRTITFDSSDGSNTATSVTRTVTIDQVLDTFSSTTTGTQTIFGAGDLGSESIFSSTFASTPSGISISGSATVTDGALRLTNSGSQVGTATINPSGSAEQTKYFTSTFDVKIGDNTTGTDGDGWSFNYGGTSFTGGNPEERSTTGLAITFDTFDNGSGDVFNQVLVDGAVRGTANAPGGTLLTETPQVLTLDGDNDYVDAGGGSGGELRITGTMTAEVWVQPDTFDEETKVVSIGGNSGDGDGAENFLWGCPS